jgi:tetratricopeptide (TPR) repeat protein
MKAHIFWACCLLFSCVTAVRSDGNELAEARLRWLHGNYAEARTAYEKLAKDSARAVEATVGLSRTLESQGEYDQALQAVDASIKNNATSGPLQARRAELLYLRGRWEEAEAAAESALKLQPESFPARWVRGQVYRDRGEIDKADGEFRWFVRTYTERSDKDKDIKDPDELLLVGLAGAENARWHNLSDQYQVILADVYGDALNAEKDFWPAEYEAGMLLLEKCNRAEAVAAFTKALTINPHAALALAARGEYAFERYEMKDAEAFAERALHVNSNLPEALRLRADVYLFANDTPAALRTLERARQINPRDEATLGRIAACYLLQGKKTALEDLTKEVRQRDPKPGIFLAELAARLESRQYFDEAEKYYKAASVERDMLPGPRNSLGLLYMRLGREKEAYEVLSRAFRADEFNVLVSNSLKVLRHLDRYETIKTDHFELKFDPQADSRLARYMVPYLEEIYTRLVDGFAYRPTSRILIEVFSTHEKFSGRVTSLPDLHTVGACTGRVLAMVSPHGEGIARPFNWARVLRHELVHMFNLEQTHFQVPHWFTEGLAVINEGYPRPQQWNQLLRQRVASGDLMNLDNIELGFIRPRSPADWSMAYCQSQLYIQYLRQKYGPGSIGEMLAAYRDGLDTTAALQKICRVDKKNFEDGYQEYVREVVKTLQGRPIETPMSYGQLQRKYEERPDDFDLAARLAEQHLLRRDTHEARRLVDLVLAKQPKHALATYVKARLLLNAGEDEEARKILEAVVDRAAPEPKVLQLLGKLYFEAREFEKAIATYELGHKSEPEESHWLADLARVYASANQTDKRIEVLKQMMPFDADDLEGRKRLMKLLLSAGRNAEAEQYARQALEIDVRDAEAAEVLEKALTAQGKKGEAEKTKALLDGKP